MWEQTNFGQLNMKNLFILTLNFYFLSCFFSFFLNNSHNGLVVVGDYAAVAEHIEINSK